jgi:hypothetical protein
LWAYLHVMHRAELHFWIFAEACGDDMGHRWQPCRLLERR